jgi:hypothetical protein
MAHVRRILWNRDKDPTGCRRDVSPRIHSGDCRFYAKIRFSLSTSSRKVLWNPLIPGNRRFLDIEEKAICRYLDRLDKLGLPARRELLRRAADYILLANWTPASTDEKPPSVGQHWVRRLLKRHPEYTLERQKVLDLERKRAESYENLRNRF